MCDVLLVTHKGYLKTSNLSQAHVTVDSISAATWGISVQQNAFWNGARIWHLHTEDSLKLQNLDAYNLLVMLKVLYAGRFSW